MPLLITLALLLTGITATIYAFYAPTRRTSEVETPPTT